MFYSIYFSSSEYCAVCRALESISPIQFLRFLVKKVKKCYNTHSEKNKIKNKQKIKISLKSCQKLPNEDLMYKKMGQRNTKSVPNKFQEEEIMDKNAYSKNSSNANSGV